MFIYCRVATSADTGADIVAVSHNIHMGSERTRRVERGKTLLQASQDHLHGYFRAKASLAGPNHKEFSGDECPCRKRSKTDHMTAYLCPVGRSSAATQTQTFVSSTLCLPLPSISAKANTPVGLASRAVSSDDTCTQVCG
jgi:hypothetical protein